MSLSKSDAIEVLVRLFNDNQLTFRDIAVLKSVFDQAVKTCNDGREEDEAEYHMGRAVMPRLASQSTEDDFYFTAQVRVETSLRDDGVVLPEKTLAAVTKVIVDKCELSHRDFFVGFDN